MGQLTEHTVRGCLVESDVARSPAALEASRERARKTAEGLPGPPCCTYAAPICPVTR